ncbi:class I SAM-dependent methyltransferase [Microvirga alba]|uniref:Methyltransferase regulatory domain-containing protein n=1 Tax=Microvirga alba TaxID=2791025 RepID=A0A931FT35_9HYPH|nr:class I SAM-dependent methyltransferase [Microvirga alba]MBF9234321.1 methyltransferase regulatory domain-containing protein [Microvirga alba]
MAEWSSGYVVDVGYTYGFYHELTPNLLGLLALRQGVQAPGLDLEPLTYCELGCGQGFSVNLLAAANPHIQFYATDFNPGHIAGAHALARSAKLKNVQFADDSFVEFVDRDDLPDFDFINLHGIYSWISDENRQSIVRFIRKKLKPGGVVYISYNSMPGWASIMPLRRLMVEHAASKGSLPLTARINASLDFASKIKELDSRYFASHPGLASRLDRLKTQNSDYLAHEYFNRDLNPFYFSDVARELSEAKLTWVGPAAALDMIDALHLSPEQSKFLDEIDDVSLRQTVRDHIVEQHFRRDIFIKGPVRLSASGQKEKWLEARFVLSRAGGNFPRKLRGLRYSADFQGELYDSLIAILERGPRSIGDVLSEPTLAKVGPERVTQAVLHLCALGVCHPCLPERDLAERQAHASQLNMAIADQARHGNTFRHFASAVTGGGIAVDRIDQLIWLAKRSGDADIPGFIWNILTQAGHRLVKDGKTLATAEENLAEISRRLAQFETNSSAIWRNLGLEPEMSASHGPKRQRSAT